MPLTVCALKSWNAAACARIEITDEGDEDMKKIWPAVFCLLFLCSCGKEIGRAEAMQEQYKNLASYETDVRVSVPRGDETLVYALHLSAQGDAVRATVSEPEELTGVGAVLEGDKLTLTFDDLVLDVGHALAARFGAFLRAARAAKLPESVSRQLGCGNTRGRRYAACRFFADAQRRNARLLALARRLRRAGVRRDCGK